MLLAAIESSPFGIVFLLLTILVIGGVPNSHDLRSGRGRR